MAYEKTQELARDLRVVGCGDLDVEGRNTFHHLIVANIWLNFYCVNVIEIQVKDTKICI